MLNFLKRFKVLRERKDKVEKNLNQLEKQLYAEEEEFNNNKKKLSSALFDAKKCYIAMNSKYIDIKDNNISEDVLLDLKPKFFSEVYKERINAIRDDYIKLQNTYNSTSVTQEHFQNIAQNSGKDLFDVYRDAINNMSDSEQKNTFLKIINQDNYQITKKQWNKSNQKYPVKRIAFLLSTAIFPPKLYFNYIRNRGLGIGVGGCLATIVILIMWLGYVKSLAESYLLIPLLLALTIVYIIDNFINRKFNPMKSDSFKELTMIEYICFDTTTFEREFENVYLESEHEVYHRILSEIKEISRSSKEELLHHIDLASEEVNVSWEIDLNQVNRIPIDVMYERKKTTIKSLQNAMSKLKTSSQKYLNKLNEVDVKRKKLSSLKEDVNREFMKYKPSLPTAYRKDYSPNFEISDDLLIGKNDTLKKFFTFTHKFMPSAIYIESKDTDEIRYAELLENHVKQIIWDLYYRNHPHLINVHVIAPHSRMSSLKADEKVKNFINSDQHFVTIYNDGSELNQLIEKLLNKTDEVGHDIKAFNNEQYKLFEERDIEQPKPYDFLLFVNMNNMSGIAHLKILLHETKRAGIIPIYIGNKPSARNIINDEVLNKYFNLNNTKLTYN